MVIHFILVVFNIICNWGCWVDIFGFPREPDREPFAVVKVVVKIGNGDGGVGGLGTGWLDMCSWDLSWSDDGGWCGCGGG